MELWILIALQSVFTVMAFYSGSWSSDTIRDRLQIGAREALDWHYLWGRIVLLSSLITGTVVVVATIATRHKKKFALIAILLSFALSILSLIAGASGGGLVHEHGVNLLFIERPTVADLNAD